MNTGRGATRIAPRRVRLTSQTKLASLASALLIASALVLAFAPIPFVTWAPGNAYDLLAERNGQPTLEVTNATTYPSTGKLLLLTVAQSRSDVAVTLPEALLAFWGPNRAVLPRDVVYPNGSGGQRTNEVRSLNPSQQAAVVAALRTAGRPVTAMPEVSQVTTSGPANGLLLPGDFVTAVDGVATTSPDEVYHELQKKKIGGKTTLSLLRDGHPGQVVVPVVGSNPDETVPVIGATFVVGYAHTEQVTLRLDQEVVGSSGGLMLALAIYDRLAPYDLPAGRIIGGTGKIEVDGTISAIGGAPEKLAAAEAAHASVFIVPASNCADLANAKTRMRVVKASTLADAITDLHDLEDPAKAASVPTC